MSKVEQNVLNVLETMQDENGQVETYVKELCLKNGYKDYNSRVKYALQNLINEGKISVLSETIKNKSKHYLLKINSNKEVKQNNEKVIEIPTQLNNNETIKISRPGSKKSNKPIKNPNASIDNLYQYLLENSDVNGVYVSQKYELSRALKYSTYRRFMKDIEVLTKNNKITIKKAGNGRSEFIWTILEKSNINNVTLQTCIPEYVNSKFTKEKHQPVEKVEPENQIETNDIDEFFETFTNVTKQILINNAKSQTEIANLEIRVAKLEEKVAKLEENNIDLKLDLEGAIIREKKWISKATQYKEMLYSRE